MPLINKYGNTLPWPVCIDYLIILTLSLLLIGMAPMGGMVYDTARSLSAAYQIADTQQFPLKGPVFAGVLHFGPVWYYFLSIPMFFGSGVTGVMLWCKFWYALTTVAAYKLGWALPHYKGSERAFGLCLVGFLYALGWHSMTGTIVAHTMYQWLSVLVSILYLHKAIKHQKTSGYLISGLFFSLALHAHPTALVLAPFYIYLAIAYGMAKQQVKMGTLLFSLGFIMPFLPYLIDQSNTGWSDFYSAGKFINNSWAADDQSSIFSILGSIFIKGPIYAAQQFSLIKPGIHVIWQISILLLTVFAVFKKNKIKQVLILIFLFLLMTWCLIKIKTVTHFYMTFSHWLVFSIVAAYVIGQMRYSTAIIVLVITMAITSQIMTLYRVNHTGYLGYTEKPADLLADIDTSKALKHYRYPYMDNRTRVSLSQYLCDKKYHQIQFGGALALQVELSGGIEYILECGDSAPEIFLFGLPFEQTLIGMTNTQAKAKGGCHGMQINNICLEQPKNWQQAEDVRLLIANPKIYPPRQRIKPNDQSQLRTIGVQLNKGDVLLLSNPLIAWMPWEILDYDENVAIIYQDEVSIMFRANVPGTHAEISFKANNPDYIQISQLAGLDSYITEQGNDF